jgi:hypothetical protein
LAVDETCAARLEISLLHAAFYPPLLGEERSRRAEGQEPPLLGEERSRRAGREITPR